MQSKYAGRVWANRMRGIVRLGITLRDRMLQTGVYCTNWGDTIARASGCALTRIKSLRPQICTGILRAVVVTLIGSVMVCGCTVAQAPMEQATPSPPVTPQQIASTTELANPLEEFWNRFEQAGEPYLLQLDAQTDSDRHIEMLDKSLALSQHMQRLQQMFYALTGLGQSGEAAAGWSGMLVGGSEGTGDIEATQQGYAFTCAFSDMSTLSGTLQHDVLRGEWTAQDRQPRTGEILLAKTGWYSFCKWEEENSLLFISDDALWFAQGVDGLPPASQSPADWADWSYRDGAFTVMHNINKEEYS